MENCFWQDENNVGKEERVGYQYFLFFPHRIPKGPFSDKEFVLPNDKFLDWSKLKEFADDKLKVTEKLKFVLEGHKRRTLLLQYFSFSHNIFIFTKSSAYLFFF